MIELLTTLSVTQIAIIFTMMMLAMKELLTVCEFFYSRARQHFDKDYKKNNEIQEVLKKIEAHELRSVDRAKEYHELVNSVSELKNECEKNFKEQDARLELLTQSDKDSIKSWIVQEYHYFVEQQKWIDDFSLDSIEKRLTHYEAEGGNSYIHDLIHEIRRLPKHPPNE